VIRLNCWEFKECGKEFGGVNAFNDGECPASIDFRFNGIHEGRFAGRSCWVIAGTMCDGSVQGDFSGKIDGCAKCDFYNYVKEQEGDRLMPTVQLIKKLDE
jgi:hypothetical protein